MRLASVHSPWARILSSLMILTLILMLCSCSQISYTDGDLAAITPVSGEGEEGWYLPAADAYEYPITPLGTPDKWAEFTSNIQMLDAVQIPADLIGILSTEGLVETCANYPKMSDFTRFDYSIYGMESIERNFNGIQELHQREDAAAAFVAFYRSINVSALFEIEEFPSIQLAYIEFLLADDTLIGKMTSEQRILLMDAVYDNYLLQQESEITGWDRSSKALLLGRLLAAESPAFQERLTTDTDAKVYLVSGIATMSFNKTWDGLEDFIQSLEPQIQEILPDA